MKEYSLFFKGYGENNSVAHDNAIKQYLEKFSEILLSYDNITLIEKIERSKSIYYFLRIENLQNIYLSFGMSLNQTYFNTAYGPIGIVTKEKYEIFQQDSSLVSPTFLIDTSRNFWIPGCSYSNNYVTPAEESVFKINSYKNKINFISGLFSKTTDENNFFTNNNTSGMMYKNPLMLFETDKNQYGIGFHDAANKQVTIFWDNELPLSDGKTIPYQMYKNLVLQEDNKLVCANITKSIGSTSQTALSLLDSFLTEDWLWISMPESLTRKIKISKGIYYRMSNIGTVGAQEMWVRTDEE